VAQLWEKYKKEVEKGKDPKKVLDKMGVKRYCCRSLFLTHVDLIDYMVKYKK
jgi:DNA-directed RNA polymerase subunit N